jgi:RHS repeat-associated protein
VKVADTSTGATVAEYRYDGRNYRIAKMVPNGANWDRTDFYYTGEWQGVEDRVLLNSASKDTVATSPKYQYAWDSRYIDAVLTRDENKDGDASCTGGGDERLYYVHDTVFSVRALLTTAGTVVERNKFDAYGKVTVCDAAGAPKADPSEGTYDNQHFFTGHRRDSSTLSYYCRARYYHTDLGRFLSRDLVHDGTNNWYEYAYDNPLSFPDPSGLTPICKAVVVSGPAGDPHPDKGVKPITSWSIGNGGYQSSWLYAAETTAFDGAFTKAWARSQFDYVYYDNRNWITKTYTSSVSLNALITCDCVNTDSGYKCMISALPPKDQQTTDDDQEVVYAGLIGHPEKLSDDTLTYTWKYAVSYKKTIKIKGPDLGILSFEFGTGGSEHTGEWTWKFKCKMSYPPATPAMAKETQDTYGDLPGDSFK